MCEKGFVLVNGICLSECPIGQVIDDGICKDSCTFKTG